jgi:hypothetical protein
MVGAALLHGPTYEEIKADRSATIQAVIVVVMGGVARWLGTPAQLPALFVIVVLVLVWWVTWLLIIYLLGTTLFRKAETEADWSQLARTTGFAQSPAVFQVLGIIPALGVTGDGVLYLVVTFWRYAAMTVAVRRTLDFRSSWRAAGLVITGFVPWVVIELVVLS